MKKNESLQSWKTSLADFWESFLILASSKSWKFHDFDMNFTHAKIKWN